MIHFLWLMHYETPKLLRNVTSWPTWLITTPKTRFHFKFCRLRQHRFAHTTHKDQSLFINYVIIILLRNRYVIAKNDSYRPIPGWYRSDIYFVIHFWWLIHYDSLELLRNEYVMLRYGQNDSYRPHSWVISIPYILSK